MASEKRRQSILEKLNMSENTISATKLSRELNVSRQIIVGDIAILRAAGHDIIATPRGYVLPRDNANPKFKIACKHDFERMREELEVIVDCGGRILDVIVEHPIYGELHGNLDIESRLDVDNFIAGVQSQNAPPLSSLTDGVHLHTISCKDKQTFELIKQNLYKAKILFDE